jgi:hypothetical protein
MKSTIDHEGRIARAECLFLPLATTYNVVMILKLLAIDPEARVRFPALPDFLEKRKQ